MKIKDKETRKLIRKMKAEGWSNRAIGRELGIPETTIRDYINGKTWSGEGKLQYDPEDVALSKKQQLYLDQPTDLKIYGGCYASCTDFTRVPKKYREAEEGTEEYEVYQQYLKMMESLNKNISQNGILFVGLNEYERDKLVEDVRSGKYKFTCSETGKPLVLDKVYEDRITLKVEDDKPKVRVLVLDIETKYMLLEGWQMFNQNFSVDQIAEDWSILSYSAKWLDSDEVLYSDVTEKTEDDILQELWDLLDEAHFVIAHNGKRFDLKKIRARMITRGFIPYSPIRVIDTLEIAKTEFAFTSNKLLYLTRLLCKKNQKSSHGKFAGHMLWKEFLKGNPEAIEEMRHYNCIDVVSLQELYEIMAPWSSKLPNFDIYEEVIENSVWQEYGYVYTNLAKYQQYRNIKTGQFRRGRTNLISKEERSKLLANI